MNFYALALLCLMSESYAIIKHFEIYRSILLDSGISLNIDIPVWNDLANDTSNP